MVYKFSCFQIQDSSTAKKFKIFHVYRQHKNRAVPGTLVLGVIRRELYRKRFFKKKKLFALLMTIRSNTFRPNGSYYYRFDYASGMLLNETRENFYALKLFCPITLEMRQSSFRDICQYSRKLF